jgi:large subunit ribosomal protein L24
MKLKTNCHIKVGDKIKVITGIHKGFVGSVSTILFKKSIVFIEGILPRIKYVKNREGGEAKEIELKVPIHISNVMLWDKDSKKASRIGYRIIESKKYRYFKKSGNIL